MFPWMNPSSGRKQNPRYDTSYKNFYNDKACRSCTYKPNNKSNYLYKSYDQPYQYKTTTNAFVSPRTTTFRSPSYYPSTQQAWESYSSSGGDDFNTGVTNLSYSKSGGGNDYGMKRTIKLEDKAELQHLNDRLSEYINRVRQLWEQRGQIDSSAFLKSTKILEDEVLKLKDLYEYELANLRGQLQGSVQDKHSLEQQYGSFIQTSKDLEKRLALEVDKNRELVGNVTSYQQTISCLEQEIAKLRSAPQPLDEGPSLRKEIADLRRDREDFKGRWERELQTRKDVEEAFAASTKKYEFDNNVLRQHVADLKQRLEATTANILSLETRIRQLSKTDTNIPDILRQVRHAAEDELKKHQSDIESRYGKSISVLKSQMENDADTIGRLEKEKSYAMGSVGDFKAKIAALESQVGAMAQQKQSLEALLAQERSRAFGQIQEMEKRFKEIQHVLFVKLEEAKVSKDSYIPLKAEIEAMKMLLAEEERRLSAPINYESTVSNVVSYSPAMTRTHVASYAPAMTSTKVASYHPGMTRSQTMSYTPAVSRAQASSYSIPAVTRTYVGTGGHKNTYHQASYRPGYCRRYHNKYRY
ncbi:lamin-A-like [Mytilus trossulus]|uniref:lamin-A-like n=1 Tax=Mytilus trossulus TaxID=6551 RepID=UPI003007EDF6